MAEEQQGPTKGGVHLIEVSVQKESPSQLIFYNKNQFDIVISSKYIK